MPQKKRDWQEHLTLVSQGQRERRHAKLQHARAIPYEVTDIFSGLDPFQQPLRAKRTPIPIIDPNDVLDFSEIFQAEEQRQEEEEIRRSLEKEEERQRVQNQREAERERELQAELGRQRKLKSVIAGAMENETRAREAEEERARREQEEEEQRKQQEEESLRKQQEEEAQRKQQQDTPRRPRIKERAHRYDNDKDERRKKFKNDTPAWERRPPPPPPPKVKRKYKFKPGTVALKEIKKYQRSSDLLIPKSAFSRVVREVVEEMSDSATRIQSNALLALQEATEDILVSNFQDSVLCHVHRQCVTLMPKDWALALRLRCPDCLRKDH